MTDDIYDNNNKKYKMINECDPEINNKNVKHLSYRSFKNSYKNTVYLYTNFIEKYKNARCRYNLSLELLLIIN